MFLVPYKCTNLLSFNYGYDRSNQNPYALNEYLQKQFHEKMWI